MEDQPNPTPPSPTGGIHISRGVRLRIPAGGLIITTAQGSSAPAMEIKAVELQLDTCVHWLEIALEHLANAKSAHEALRIAPTSPDLGILLDREFKASVQAASSAATFFEALYAATMERNPPRQPLIIRNPKKRPTRYAVVTEQLRRSFGLKKQGTANLRSVLHEIYRFRDQAVHPSAAFTEPVLHPHLHVGVEHRFVMYSASNAQQLVRASLAYSKMLCSRDLTRQPKEIQDLAAYLLEVCASLYIKWEEMYGPLFDPPPKAG